MTHPIALAGSVILDAEGRLLLLHRSVPGHEQWETPGGRVECGEVPEEAARRETREELGIEVEIVRPLGKALFEQEEQAWEYHWFLVEVISGQPEIQERHRHDRLQYFHWEQLRQLESLLSPNTRNLLAARFSGGLAL